MKKKKKKKKRIVFLALAAYVVTIAHGPALAHAAEPDAKEACATAYENVQRLRQAGQLRASKAQLPACEAASCPTFMRDDCTKWDTEITDAMPTIVVGAKDENGHDATAVRVIVDDIVVADKLDGSPIAVDPGQHRVRYESGTQSTQDTFVIRQGEKNRQLTTTFAPATAPETTESHRRIPTVTWILGGVAAAGVVSFTAFAIAGKSKEGCAPTCSQSNVDSLRRDYLIADISLGVGVVAAAAAVYFALTAEPTTTSTVPRAATISVEPNITTHGADVSLRARF